MFNATIVILRFVGDVQLFRANCTGTFGMFGRLFGSRDIRNERKADAGTSS